MKVHVCFNCEAEQFSKNSPTQHPSVRAIMDTDNNGPLTTWWFHDSHGESWRLNEGDWIVTMKGNTTVVRKDAFNELYKEGWV